YSALGTTTCPSCSNALALDVAGSHSGSSRSDEAPATNRQPEGAVARADAAPSDRHGAVEAERKSAAASPAPTSGREPLVASSPPVSARAGFAGAAPLKSPSKPKSVEELMEQAKNFVCRSCSTPVPVGHKFCGRCGAAVPPEILNARTQFFGQLQAPGKAK